MDESKDTKVKRTIQRIGGYLKEVLTVVDATGKVVGQTVTPLMVELRPRDVMQIIVGASILAVPVAFTEETWNLGATLPLKNVLFLTSVSVVFIAGFVYYNFYRFHLKEHVLEYIKRVAAVYLFSLIVVGLILTIIQKCPWGTDNLLAIKRIIIVAFPASMSAAVSDTLK
ncbi:DUF2391 family protein [Verrucomicrobiota bacterium]